MEYKEQDQKDIYKIFNSCQDVTPLHLVCKLLYLMKQ